jgi:putative nucleotidyltransferase with HDIG domain
VPKTSTPCFLAVDDQPEINDLMLKMLTMRGFRGEACTDASQALRLLQQGNFQVVLSDLNIPGMDGLELLNKVRTNFPEVAFVMITGAGDVQSGIRAMKAGASDYLLKPVQADEVVACIHRALEVKRLDRELKKNRNSLEAMIARRTKQLERALKRVEKTYDETLQVLGRALDFRDTETAGHSYRVTRYSLELATAMKCTPFQLRQIARGAYLHDVGKIGIPDSILMKPGPLTEQEKAIMEAHVKIGYELVSRISFLADPAEIVLTHQERFDGQGYPQGLSGKEIPLGARIFALADTLDAMTSDRPYRKALPYSAAREEIIRESGRQFDPEVVEAFLLIPEQVWKKIRLEIYLHHFLPDN